MKTFSIFSFIALFAIVTSLAIAPASADHATASVSAPAGTSVPGCEETNECFIPSEVTVDVGGEVTWSNDDTAAHTVTSGSAADGPDGVFDSSLFMAGATFSHKFEEAGTYNYFCMVHPWMEGSVVVQAEAMEEEHAEEEMHMEEETHAEEEVHEEVMEETEEMMEEVMEETEEMMEEVMEETEEMVEDDTIMRSAEMEAEEADESGGGCLIATAAFGSELAPQVQFLREVRDNTVMSTASGTTFMTGFNQLYYSFSPTIADLERENPVFQEAVRAFITPMISTLSIMTLAQDGSESDVLTAGISVIALNLAMYIAAPAMVAFKVSQHIKSRK